MIRPKIIILVICLHILIDGTRGADKYTDENRPYEFGFTIDGEQHRHEKKDENGIIMGEFGFITADGVYHVTVYATDENGRFKILSMKNIRVKPYPTAGVKKGHSLPFPPSGNAPVLQGPSKTSTVQDKSNPQQIGKQVGSSAKACSHCSLPTTTTKAPQLTDIAVVSKDRIPATTVTAGKGAPSIVSSQPFLQSHNNQDYQQGNKETPGFGEQESYSKGEGNIEQRMPASELEKNIPPSLSYRSNIPQSQNSYSQPESFANQQNYAQQERGLGQTYQQNGFNDNINFQENSKNKPQVGQIGITNVNYPQQQSSINPPSYQQRKDTNQNFQSGNDGYQNYPQFGTGDVQNYQNGNTANYPQGERNNNRNIVQNQQSDNNSNSVQRGSSNTQPGSMQPSSFVNTYPENLQTSQGTLRNPKQYSTTSSNSGLDQSQGFGAILASQGNQPISNKPTLVAAQMQIVPKDTDIYHKRPGEKEGLPDGISKDDVTKLLYTFNYTVGFHGHHEEGYVNGAKQGYYFVTGRNGVRTRIDYIADEKGFRPRISQEVLDIASDDVPKPETEKDEKFGLKGYEFKWLYFPSDDNRKQ